MPSNSFKPVSKIVRADLKASLAAFVSLNLRVLSEIVKADES